MNHEKCFLSHLFSFISLFCICLIELFFNFLLADLDVEQLNIKTIQFECATTIYNGPTLTRSFVSLKVNELLLFLSALRNFFLRNLVHGKLSNYKRHVASWWNLTYRSYSVFPLRLFIKTMQWVIAATQASLVFLS